MHTKTGIRTKQKGIATVELAIVLPLLLMILSIMGETGYVLFQQNTLTKTVQSGSRFLAGKVMMGTGLVELTALDIQQTRNLIVYGNIAGDGDPVMDGLDPFNVSIQCTYGTVSSHCAQNGNVAPITINVEHNYTPLLGNLLNNVTGVNLFPLQLSASVVVAPF